MRKPTGTTGSGCARSTPWRDAWVWVVALAVAACASSKPAQDPRYTIVRPGAQGPPTGGIPPDKEAEITLVLQQREPSTLKCYNDVLNRKLDRDFQGTVRLLVRVEKNGRAASVRVIGGTLEDEEVRACLIETISAFEFPTLDHAGDVQYEYRFRPLY